MAGTQRRHLGLQGLRLLLQVAERDLALDQILAQLVQGAGLLVRQYLASGQRGLLSGQLDLASLQLGLGFRAQHQGLLARRDLRLHPQGLPLPHRGGADALDFLRPGLAGLREAGTRA